jgi:O-antigen/teichoic acid export membrane protein
MQKNFFYYLLPSIIIGVLSALVMVPITTYYLNPKDFGIYAIVNAITMPIGPLASTGVTWVLAGNYYKIEGHERKTLLFNLLLLDFIFKLFWVVIFWLLTPWLLPAIVKDFEPQYEVYFKLSLIATVLTAFWPSISYFIVLQQKGRLHAIFEISQWIGSTLVTIVCLSILKLSTITLFLSPLASGAIMFILGLWYVKDHINPEINKKWLREIFKVGIPSIPSNLVEMATNISDRYFIQKWINLSRLGIYSHSMSYKNIFTMGTKAFSRTFTPFVLETYSNNLDSKHLGQKLKKWYGLLGIAGIFITLFSHEVVAILTHGKFVDAAQLIPIWFLLILSYTYGMPYSQFLFVHKKNTFMMYSGILISAVFIGITAFSVFTYGILGATVAIVLSNFAIQCSQMIYARMLGCARVGDNYFIYIVAMILGVFIANKLFAIDIIVKTIGFTAAAVFLMNNYDLYDAIKNNYLRTR